MITRRATLALACLTMAAAYTASADERPVVLPTHDVAVEYDAQGGTDGRRPPERVRVRFGSGRLRVEPAGLRGYVLVDPDSGRATVVMTEQHVYLDMPAEIALGQGWVPPRQLAFSRVGTERVAGQPCTVWAVSAPKGRTGTACLTADGVLLRGAGEDPQYGAGSLRAVSVSAAQQPASLFRPPPGFVRLDIPRLPGGLDLSTLGRALMQ